MGEEIPEWAWERAEVLCKAERSSTDWWTPNRDFPSVSALARYIAQHEEPPVDPLLIEARKLYADAHRAGRFHLQLPGAVAKYGAAEKQILAGDFDYRLEDTLAALRRGIELAKSEPSHD